VLQVRVNCVESGYWWRLGLSFAAKNSSKWRAGTLKPKKSEKEKDQNSVKKPFSGLVVENAGNHCC
jgi:hypothetical protein